MKLSLIWFGLSMKPRKRFEAILMDGRGQQHHVHFGSKDGHTYIDGASREERKRYQLRHEPRENWDDPLSPGAWARWVLWGNSPVIDINLDRILERFDIEDARYDHARDAQDLSIRVR